MHKLDKIPKLLKDKKDKSLFIVGGGPSLTEFDWELLKDKNVLVINRHVSQTNVSFLDYQAYVLLAIRFSDL